ncbi:tRNA (adenosine(37)-N6)-threonylcarbamoyltransferase complex dimerization subunit type 1 TsaB [Candidatus Gottesmanbacteria bacterium]|nr:tRNA (adenosine(37)-N6)-threonylcarbamoyltransferase complex dimerization subunit type 1 TsaB [Candidatus Gottesmanbacteria bacterium]
MQKILYIDTTDNQKVLVSINGEEKLTVKAKVTILKAQIVLPLIEKLLKKNGIKLSEITEIKVNIGPGSFTGIRVGLSVANALAYALGIKVNAKDQETDAFYT